MELTIYKIVIYISPGIGDRDPTRIESDNCRNRYSNFDYGTENPDFWDKNPALSRDELGRKSRFEEKVHLE